MRQSAGGPRYDAAQSASERQEFANLILMCRNHHKVIDAPENLKEFTVGRLREIKSMHEAEAGISRVLVPELLPLELAALRLSGTTYESGSTHMDFRQAQFRVGGEGGAFGGGGGGGGVLTIVGMSQLPPDVSIDLRGDAGRAPGGGGGGGGSLNFVGRASESEDQRLGLRASSFFPANSLALNGLLHVLGAGWNLYTVPHVPHPMLLMFACIIEFGELQPNTLLRFDLTIRNPAGDVVAKESADLNVPGRDCLVRRTPAAIGIQFTADIAGIWSATLESGSLEFAIIQFEIRTADSNL